MKRFIEVHCMNPSWKKEAPLDEEDYQWGGDPTVVNVNEIVTLSVYDKSRKNGYLKLRDGRELILYESLEIMRKVLLEIPIPDEGVLALPIEELNLLCRTRTVLENMGIKTVGALTRKSRAELRKSRNLGEKSLNEIEARLLELELRLKQEDKS